jgi:hypothetical protein
LRTLDEIKNLLTDRRIDLIVQATGLHRNTITRIRDGRQANPTYYVMARLDAYFDMQGAAHE